MPRVSPWGILLAIALAACSTASPAAPGGGAPPGAAPAAPPAAGAAPAAPTARPLQRVVIGVPGPSLSYLPAHLAWKLGYFEEEGLSPEFVQISGPPAMAALINGELDFSTLLSAVGANALQGGPLRMVQFHSIRVQHVIVVRPDITAVPQLAGKRVAVDSLGTLTTFEMRGLIDHFQLPDVALVAAGGELERIAALEAGAVDGIISSIPANLVAERRGFPTLLRVGDVLDIPQAGFGTSETHLRDKADVVAGSIRAAARALPVIRGQPDEVVQIVEGYISLSPEDARRAYEQVVDTYTPNGLPTDAQLAAYLDLLQATAGAPVGTRPEQMVDFTIARRVAADLGLPSQ
jgi:NitT/TauT family transport system substrate-binding protein